MRIIGGSARGRRLRAPKGLGTRPTADRVRQTIFDILGQRCDGLRVLDLYAGTGALGLEALSRGAVHCTFVEQSRTVESVLRRNVDELGFSDRCAIRRGDALDLRGLSGSFDLVFADPPYAQGASRVLEVLAGEGRERMSDGARIVLEHARREVLAVRSGRLVRSDERRFGDTTVTFYILEAP